TANVTVSALNFTNTTTGAWHVTDIPANITLRATNVTMGGFTGNFITDVAMTDAGTFAVNGSLSIGDVASVNSISVVNLASLGKWLAYPWLRGHRRESCQHDVGLPQHQRRWKPFHRDTLVQWQSR